MGPSRAPEKCDLDKHRRLYLGSRGTSIKISCDRREGRSRGRLARYDAADGVAAAEGVFAMRLLLRPTVAATLLPTGVMACDKVRIAPLAETMQ